MAVLFCVHQTPITSPLMGGGTAGSPSGVATGISGVHVCVQFFVCADVPITIVFLALWHDVYHLF